MDLFEKLFQKISEREIFKRKASPGLVRLQDIAKYLDVFANSVVLGSGQVQSVASRDFVGLYGAQLLLPEKIDFFTDPTLNKNLYRNLILQTMGAHRARLTGPSELEAPIVQRLKFLEHSSQINLLLDGLFPGYLNFQQDLLAKVVAHTEPRVGYQRRVFEHWRKLVLNRTPVVTGTEVLYKGSRSRDPVPAFLFLTVPNLERVKIQIVITEEPARVAGQKNSDVESEVEKTYSGINQSVDIEKEKANPVMHSFEKLETADEYEGGRRIDSGEDDLEDHANALDELNLNKVTRGGEAAKSAYNADTTVDFVVAAPRFEKSSETSQFLYPEWNVKKNSYMIDHCRLVENPIEVLAGNDAFREDLLRQNRFQIKHWQSRIQNLFTEPLWQKRLKEGDEIDLDEVIRELGAMLSRKDVKARWYMSRKKQFNDVEMIILFDQSHSSDSWICNRRILDIALESVGTAGLLFDKIFDDVTVAGVWSSTRHNCSFQIYKDRSEPWSAFFSKVTAIQAQGYTRLGPAIRHAVDRLKISTHRKKLILLLTDGKPTDVDGYEGVMGLSDVAQACREAEVNGILHYALILDHKQKVHFAKMFKYFRLLHDPRMLSEELFKILFQLLTL